MFGLSFQELMIVGVVAVLLFGKRLPEVARTLGNSYQQFRKGLHDIQSEMHKMTDVRTPSSSNSYSSRDTYSGDDDYVQPTAPKFELPAPAADSTSPPPQASAEEKSSTS
jgi:sec-independent protein translocase protein TatA